jgi:hypothetical protein
MAIHAYFTAAAILLGASAGGTVSVLPRDRTSLIATHEAISKATLAHVEAFIDACESARKPQNRSTATEPNERLGRTKSSPETAQMTLPFLFVASKSGSVFHRPDCRWAQNISGDNRLSYKTREEALQTGKRPCKSCKP